MARPAASPASLLALLLAVGLGGLGAACDDPGSDVETDEAVVEDLGKADLTGELRVRSGDTSIWVDRVLAVRAADDRIDWVLEGRASRAITEGMGFVMDDPAGDFVGRGARSFEVRYPRGDRGLMAGVSHFVRLGFDPSAGRPDSLTARVLVRPRLVDSTGYGLWLDPMMTPVVVGGRTVWRVEGRVTGSFAAVEARIGDLELGGVATTDATHFTIDLADEEVARLTEGSRLEVEATTARGRRHRSAGVAIAVTRLGATTGAPYEVWPRPACEGEVAACLAALPPGTSDLSACGEALAVLACPSAGGGAVAFDEAAFLAALARADATMAAGIAHDADALVGDAKVDDFLYGVRETIQSRFEQMFGQDFATAAERDAAADAAATAALDHVYAYPLELVDERLPPIAGDLARTRQIVADRLLDRLASIDLAETEFGRPLVELSREFRARHVADLRALRQAAELVSNGATVQVFAGRWLDPYVEITIDKATGAATAILFEID